LMSSPSLLPIQTACTREAAELEEPETTKPTWNGKIEKRVSLLVLSTCNILRSLKIYDSGFEKCKTKRGRQHAEKGRNVQSDSGSLMEKCQAATARLEHNKMERN